MFSVSRCLRVRRDWRRGRRGYSCRAVAQVVGLATNASLTSLTRKPAGAIYHDPDLIAIARAGFGEAAAVAKASGIGLPDDNVDQALQTHQKFPPQMFASMYHDLVRGRRLELESLSGLIVRRGRALGVPTPFHAMAYARLKRVRERYARSDRSPMSIESDQSNFSRIRKSYFDPIYCFTLKSCIPSSTAL